MADGRDAAPNPALGSLEWLVGAWDVSGPEILLRPADAREGGEPMKGQVLFVHGGGEGAHAADGRLAASLREAMGDDLGVRYPKMPGEDAPEHGAWRGRISEELTRMSGEVILVGHSLGASILLKYLSEEEPEKPIAGVFLLAAPFWGAADWEVEEYELRENFASKLPEGLPVSLYHGRDDEVVPFEHLALYAKKLPHATVRELGGRGHQFGDDLSDLARDIGEILSGARAERTAATARERRPRQPEEDA